MHITRKHQSVAQFASTLTDACTIISSSTNDSPTEIPNYSAPPLNQDELNIQTFYEKFFELYEKFFQFSLMLKEKHTLSAATYHDIMQNLIKMFSHLQCFYAVENDVETSPHMTVIDCESLWVSMRKQSVFKSFCRNIGYIEPKQVTLSSQPGDFYYYVPILKTPVSYISHEDVFGSRIAPQANHHLDAHLLSDYTNGEYFKKSSYFKGNPSLLRLHLYCDEVEVCNPIGSSKGLHKLVCVYYILGNIET